MGELGRARPPFLGACCHGVREHFPDRLGDVDADELHRAANKVEPSLIRVEADEVTYNLHVALRFELERALFAAGSTPPTSRRRGTSAMRE